MKKQEQIKALLEKVKELPQSPGVYKFKNIKGEIIYIGKAKNLRSRVKSYFQDNLDVGSKTYALVSRIRDLEYIEALSEFEALLLEAELIRQYRPKYNISLKDDKSYLYIVIRNEKLVVRGKKVGVPRILTARKPDLMDNDTVFGPYPDGSTAKYIVRTVRKIIPFRDCSVAKYTRYQNLGRPCLYGDLGLCSAPCTDNLTIEEYRDDIHKIKKLLSGDSVQIVNTLKKEMDMASKEQNFEKAAHYRDIIQKFDYIRQSFKSANTYIENPYLVEDMITESLDELVKNIPVMRNFPERIECYDISNISGKEAVGAMVVATDGRIDKSQYRKFKIKFKQKPDDFDMMREVLARRFKNDWPKPDLIVLDGGKGQVSAGMEVMKRMNIDIPLTGLAKRFETIVYTSGSEFIELNLDKNNEGLRLLQRLRNEAHRFAQKYHHHLRLKKIE
ncbi:MAG: Excinuclease ABC subunit C [candidate division WWE3 bacterium GW2011_GWC1_41_7]|uniref:Excinuclease ABC subunit C n=1 Tax=candidate division WWE3 bacterium GW2011_GWC1_41_7 TaxID=1619119 RepID=A0A0G1A7P5_UNCKA|nr:MAG: Excinuclease ABC subunit C [candidate division WWE3 bacterium GW2011_GWC1_41_7]